ncbi:MAG: TonB-dependent receptor [Opitutus sp.]|nr:TonB-dependent receptor [Opitutus sp.]
MSRALPLCLRASVVHCRSCPRLRHRPCHRSQRHRCAHGGDRGRHAERRHGDRPRVRRAAEPRGRPRRRRLRTVERHHGLGPRVLVEGAVSQRCLRRRDGSRRSDSRLTRQPSRQAVGCSQGHGRTTLAMITRHLRSATITPLRPNHLRNPKLMNPDHTAPQVQPKRWDSFRFSAFLLGSLFAIIGNSRGAAAAPASTGTIEGRVFDAGTGAALAKAQVAVEGTRRMTTTDDGGRFLISIVPAGTARLVVEYIGLEKQIVSVDVPAGGVARSEIELRRRGKQTPAGKDEVVQLEKFEVVEASEMSAQAIAMNEQRQSASIKNVVAFGEFGDRSPENIGEFLKFLPGISVVQPEGSVDAESISVRGIPANNVGILVDGVQLASAVNDNSRAVSLRGVPLSNISRVEVTKVPTPDYPASGLGGTVNIISASPFDKKIAGFSYQSYIQFNKTNGFSLGGGRREPISQTSAKFNQPSIEMQYSVPLNPNLAVNIAASRTWRQSHGEDQLPSGWDLVRNVLANAQYGKFVNPVTTRSGQFGMDWRLGSSDWLSASVQRRHFDRPISRSGFNPNFGAGASGDGTFTQGAATAVGSITQGVNWRIDNYESTNVSLKYRHLGLVWRVDASGGWSKSDASQQEMSKGFFQNATTQLTNLILRGDGMGGDTIIPTRYSATNSSGASVDLYNGNNYSLVSASTGEYSRDAVVGSARVDLTRDFAAKVPVMLKFGTALNREKRDARAFPKTWNFRPNGASDVNSRLAGRFDLFDEDFLRNPTKLWGVPYREVSQKKAYDLFRLHRDWFVEDEALSHQNMASASRVYTETISAGYARVDVRFLDRRLWIATGVRYEHTAGKGQGPLDDINAQYQHDANGKFVLNTAGQRILITNDALALRKLRFRERAARTSSDYGDYYPSLNATYDLTDKLVLRAAYAKTIGRPNLNFITPGLTITDPDVAQPRITINNPNLKPWTANNYDLTLESYNFKDGFGSIGIFQKNIKNFFGSVETQATPELLALYGLQDDPTLLRYSISTQTNAGDAKVTGFEFGYRQSLTFLPNWARGFQVFFNATKLKVQGSKISDFSGFAPETFSGGINFIRPRFYIKANWSYQAETRLTLIAPSATIPANTYNYQEQIVRGSLSAQYGLTRRFAVYALISDLTSPISKTLRYAPQTPDYAKRFRYTSLDYYTTIGVKGSF